MWEYRIVTSSVWMSVDILNTLGKDEWELIVVVRVGDFYAHYFKRPLVFEPVPF
jgi:hypothetical protein